MRLLPKRVYLKGRKYWWCSPTREWVSIGSVDDYAGMLAKYRELSGGVGQRLPVTLAQLANRYLVEVMPTKAPRTQGEQTKHLEVLVAVFGHMQLDEVQMTDVARLLASGAPILRNRQVALLSHMFTMARRWGCAVDNPCRGVALNKSKRKPRYVTDAEYEGVRALAGERVQVTMELALRLGQRLGDVLALRWEQVTDAGVLVVQRKTGKAVLVEMDEGLAAALAKARSWGGATVVCNRARQPYTVSGFESMWQGVQLKWAKAGGQRFRFHDLRVKSGSDGTLEEAVARLGHASPATTARVYRAGVTRARPWSKLKGVGLVESAEAEGEA